MFKQMKIIAAHRKKLRPLGEAVTGKNVPPTIIDGTPKAAMGPLTSSVLFAKRAPK